MSIPNVDTFEHDISEEIKTKEASLTDIASASGDVNNIPNSTAQTSNLLLLLGVGCIVAVLVGGVAFYLYTVKESAIVQAPPVDTNPKPNSSLASVSPVMFAALGENIGEVDKSDYGYAMRVLSYSAVFSYMLKNESEYADELAQAVGSPRDTSTTTPPFTFTDITLNNQNMRVGTSASSTVVYAFVNTTTLLVSSSPEGILTLRSAILSQ